MKIAQANQRQAMLLAVLAIAVVALGWSYRGLILGTSASPDGKGGNKAEAVAPLDARLQTMSKIEPIPIERPDAEGIYDRQRNLFEYGQSPEALAAERARKEAERRAEIERREREAQMAKQREAEAARRALEPPRPPPPPPPPQPPPFRYTYVAYIAQLAGAQEYLAALQKREGKTTTAVVKVGDVIDDQFVVKKIDFDQVVVSYTDPRFKDQTQSVRLIPTPPKR